MNIYFKNKCKIKTILGKTKNGDYDQQILLEKFYSGTLGRRKVIQAGISDIQVGRTS